MGHPAEDGGPDGVALGGGAGEEFAGLLLVDRPAAALESVHSIAVELLGLVGLPHGRGG
jgi:hypothetical protein